MMQHHTNTLISSDTIDFTKYNSHLFDVYSDCGKYKGCVAESDICITKKTCKMLTTFYADESNSYTFEIYGSLQNGNAYIASALSFDTKMGNDSVMACILNSTSNTVDVQMYWNYATYYSAPLNVS